VVLPAPDDPNKTVTSFEGIVRLRSLKMVLPRIAFVTFFKVMLVISTHSFVTTKMTNNEPTIKVKYQGRPTLMITNIVAIRNTADKNILSPLDNGILRMPTLGFDGQR
jgi:hypothetical protein